MMSSRDHVMVVKMGAGATYMAADVDAPQAVR